MVVREDLRLDVRRLDVHQSRDAAIRQLDLRPADARRHPRAGCGGRASPRCQDAARRQRHVRPGDGSRLDRGLAARHGLGVRNAGRRRGLLRADGDPQGRASRAGRSTPRRSGACRSGSASSRTESRRWSPRSSRTTCSTARARARGSAGRRQGRPGRPTSTPTPGSSGYTPQLATAVWMGYTGGEIPMQSVHGISVSGGSFPAEIWRLFMEPALAAAAGARLPDSDSTRPSTSRGSAARSRSSTTPRLPRRRPRRTPPRRSRPRRAPDRRSRPPPSAPPACRRPPSRASSPAPRRHRPRCLRRHPHHHRRPTPASRRAFRTRAVDASSASGGSRCWAVPWCSPSRRSCLAAWRDGSGARSSARAGSPGSGPSRLFLALLVAAFLALRARVARSSVAVGRFGMAATVAVRRPARSRLAPRSCSRPTPGRTGATAGSALHGTGQPVRRPAGAVSREPGGAVPRRGVAGHDHRLRPGASRSPQKVSRRLPAARATGPPGSSRRWRLRQRSQQRCSPPGWPAVRRSRVAAVGWNPVLAVHLAGGGHNDAWLGAMLLAALALGAAGRMSRWEGSLWAAAIAVKWIPLVLLPLRLLERRATRAAARARGSLAATLAVLGALATWLYGTAWVGALGPLVEQRSAQDELRAPVAARRARNPRPVAIGAAVAAFAVGYVALARRALRGHARLGLSPASRSRRPRTWPSGTSVGPSRSRRPTTRPTCRCSSRSSSARISCLRRFRSERGSAPTVDAHAVRLRRRARNRRPSLERDRAPRGTAAAAVALSR